MLQLGIIYFYVLFIPEQFTVKAHPALFEGRGEEECQYKLDRKSSMGFLMVKGGGEGEGKSEPQIEAL